MKVAIYSRVIEYEFKKEVQRLFDELIRQNLQPVMYKPFMVGTKPASPCSSKVSSFSQLSGLKTRNFVPDAAGEPLLYAFIITFLPS